MARRPRFESRRGRPESQYGREMRQSDYSSFQTINSGLRRLSQVDGWSRGYKDNSQSLPIDRPYMNKIYRDR